MQPNPNPNPLRFMQVFHFLHLLAHLNLRRPSNSLPSPAATARRTRAIKRAAYTSMAFAVRPQRLWSRALLRSLRGTTDGRRIKRTLVVKGRRRRQSKADELRQLVPGGKRMDMCSLLQETAHYIETLNSQVKIMQKLADSSLPSGEEDVGDVDEAKKEKKLRD